MDLAPMRLGSPEHALCTVLRRAHATAPHDGLADAALAHGVLGGAGQPRRQRAAGGLPCAWRPALLLTRALALASSAAAAAAPAAARRPGAAGRAAAGASPRGAGQAKQGAVRRQPGRGAAPWHSERCGEACVSPALTLGAARDSGAAVGRLLARPLGAGGAVGRGWAIVWQGVQAAALAPGAAAGLSSRRRRGAGGARRGPGAGGAVCQRRARARAGDSQALPGYVSLYLQVTDPKSSRWDCFASYRLAVVHASDETKSIARESWHRFSSRVARPTAVARPASSSHGWADFAPVATIADARQARAGDPPSRASMPWCGWLPDAAPQMVPLCHKACAYWLARWIQ